MSSLENQSSSAIFSYTFPAMAAGTITSGAAEPVLNNNFTLGVSRILGMVRKTVGVNPGAPFIGSLTTGAAGATSGIAAAIGAAGGASGAIAVPIGAPGAIGAAAGVGARPGPVMRWMPPLTA